ncbi:MAG: ATP-dependent DNA helicase [Desulfosarcina sp.]|nr:ATP-dependent DNA helicase [Desulfobacterales bacterium]
MKPIVTVAVRTLVDFVLKSGDLELSFKGSRRSLEGLRAHQKIQRSRPEGYVPEVPIQYTLETDQLVLEVSGRIDGVFSDAGVTVIDEIKSTRRDLESLRDHQNPMHWGQARAYAWMYAARHELPRIDVQLTYYHLESGRTIEIRQSFDFETLTVFFETLTTAFLDWAEGLEQWRRRRDRAIHKLAFPFGAYRAGQRQMAVTVYRAIQGGHPALVQAPTGIGKTLGAVFPAVKALGAGLTSRIFYLTARTTGQRAAEKALALLGDVDLQLKSLTLTAKDKICPYPEAACRPDECPRARGHFDRLKGAREAAFEQMVLDRETVARLAGDFQVCPFEFSLEMALWADLVIADYNYAFDPRVYLRRFFDENGTDFTFLIDEAHNLVDRSREMFSAVIDKQRFLDLRRVLRDDQRSLYRALGKINAWLTAARKDNLAGGAETAAEDPPEDLLPLLLRFFSLAEKWLLKNIASAWREDLIQLYFDVSTFLRVADRYDCAYATCYQGDARDLTIKLFCIDPARQLAEALQRCRAAIFFSATLTPFDYFNTLFGGDDRSACLRLLSPFPRRNLCLMIDGRISTYYRERERTAAAVVAAVADLVRIRPGNYLIFFPSHAYLQMVHALFRDGHPDLNTLVQETGMDEPARDHFLARFRGDNPEALIGFVGMGGIFGEGIDLAGDRLAGAVVVGVGLPGICLERDLIRDYFETHRQAGFDFAYRLPGFNRVLQAVGRVIRTSRDRGVVLLLDQRCATRPYRELFPPEWAPVHLGAARSVASVLQDFRTSGKIGPNPKGSRNNKLAISSES